MFTIKFTFEDGIIGHLDFQTQEQVGHWLPQFSDPETMKRQRVASIVVIKTQPAQIANAA